MDDVTFASGNAFIFYGDHRDLIVARLEREGFTPRGNPDYMALSFDTATVDDVRALASFASLRPVGAKKYALIEARQMTTEAQNALLKIVEEGTGNTTFIFVVPRGFFILPTLMSRCVIMRAHAEEHHEEVGRAFLRMGYSERLALAEKFSKNHDRDGARILVRSLLAVSRDNAASPRILRDLLDADRFLQLSGSSPKSVVGHLALVL
jgi:hypothetical protein